MEPRADAVNCDIGLMASHQAVLSMILEEEVQICYADHQWDIVDDAIRKFLRMIFI